jgi:cytochrome c553
MKVWQQIKILDDIKKEDKTFLKEKSKESAATFCVECHKNTHVGLYPFWHLYRRPLCEKCGKEYVTFLRQISAYDDFNSKA